MTNETASPRKPRIALMGEFSAGKSTLANLLLGQQSSPVQVTATQLPPVWYSLGPEMQQRITAEGETVDLPPADWSSARPETTQLIRVGMEADLLYAFDLIDMPGTSDPHMAPDIWSRFLPLVDLVIWCTPANQAWRQSEAALWEQVPETLWQNSVLLITRMDKIRENRDRDRILQRVRSEAGDFFRDVLPISLTEALAGRDDQAILDESGASALVAFMEARLDSLALDDKPDFAPSRPDPAAPEAETGPAAPKSRPRCLGGAANGKVVPRRITRSGVGTRERPAMRSV